jgi:hypothetical protein
VNEEREQAEGTHDIGEYCRRVEGHLARVNDGQIIRVVGPAFELVRSWALDGVPLSVVLRGIDLKAGRHRAGASRRPLRLEFCEADVREVYTRWRRAVGLSGQAADAGGDAGEAARTARRPSLAKHLDRVVDQLSRSAGRLDLPDALRAGISRVLEVAVRVREVARGARGAARAEVAAQLPGLDAALVRSARESIDADSLARIHREASTELAAYRSRLSPDTWRQSVELSADRLLREQLGLPTIALDE